MRTLSSALPGIAQTTQLLPSERAASEAHGNHNDLSHYTLQKKTPVDMVMSNEIPLLGELASEAEIFDVFRLIYTSLGLWQKTACVVSAI